MRLQSGGRSWAPPIRPMPRTAPSARSGRRASSAMRCTAPTRRTRRALSSATFLPGTSCNKSIRQFRVISAGNGSGADDSKLRTAFMPQVQITMLVGRTLEQKRRVAQRITEVLVEDAGASREAISISFVEVPKENYASAGVLVVDKKKT